MTQCVRGRRIGGEVVETDVRVERVCKACGTFAVYTHGRL
jgi:hypothetical protein